MYFSKKKNINFWKNHLSPYETLFQTSCRSRSISQHSDLLDPDKTNDAISATENNGDNISKIDVEDSLQKSYNQMRSKLNQLEEYNKTLENQLASIFQTINATVQTEPSDPQIDTEFQDEIANPPVMSCSSKVETPRLRDWNEISNLGGMRNRQNYESNSGKTI